MADLLRVLHPKLLICVLGQSPEFRLVNVEQILHDSLTDLDFGVFERDVKNSHARKQQCGRDRTHNQCFTNVGRSHNQRNGLGMQAAADHFVDCLTSGRI